MKNTIRKALASIYAVLFGITIIWFLWGLPCLAQGISTPLPELSDPQELEVFLDIFFTEQMTKQHVPGAVFVLVKDGKIFFSKGYGYADLEKKIPVFPDKTLFRVGSVSKLFTATAVMQLAEQNKLKLDDNVNSYLKGFQIENTYNKPVTFSHLLTHSDGFDSGWGIGAFARSASEMTPLGDFIAKRLPPRILPPGEVFLYSDVGMNLAGYLVEVISGIPFAQYMDKNILQPLDMSRSSFSQPLPPQLTSDLAVGYKYKNGTYQRRSFKDETLAIYAPEFKSVEVKPLLFRFLYNNNYMTFQQDESSRITHMFISDSVFAALEKLAWYETNISQLTLLIFCTLIFFSVCVVGLSHRMRKRVSKNSKITQLAQFIAILVSALNLIFLIGIGLVLSQADFWELFFGLPRTVIALLLIPPLTTGLTLGLLIFTILAWKNQYWSMLGRTYYSLITLAAFGFISFLNYWNLLGLQL